MAAISTSHAQNRRPAGCRVDVGDRLHPHRRRRGPAAPGLVPSPLTGDLIKQALLDDAELSKMFGANFASTPNIPPAFGGLEDLPDGWAAASPQDCVAVVAGAQRSVYRSVEVRDVAREYWTAAKSGSNVTGVAEAVIALPTAADADAAFEAFSEQWNRCDGTMVSREFADTAARISDVRADNSVLTATVHSTMSLIVGLRVGRALGVRVNCLVDVEVFFPAEGSPVDDSAADVARGVLDKISGLAAGE